MAKLFSRIASRSDACRSDRLHEDSLKPSLRRKPRWLLPRQRPVVLVNRATPRLCDLYGSLGFDLAFLSAAHRINCDGDRTPARAVVAPRNL